MQMSIFNFFSFFKLQAVVVSLCVRWWKKWYNILTWATLSVHIITYSIVTQIIGVRSELGSLNQKIFKEER